MIKLAKQILVTLLGFLFVGFMFFYFSSEVRAGVCGTEGSSCSSCSAGSCTPVSGGCSETCDSSGAVCICGANNVCIIDASKYYCRTGCPSGYSESCPSGSTCSSCTADCSCGNSKTCYQVTSSTPTSTPVPTATPTPIPGCTSDGIYDDCSPKSDCGPIGSCSVCQKRTAICKDNCGNPRDSCSSDNSCDNGNPANCTSIPPPPPPPPTCSASWNYFDEPATDSTLTVGQSYNLRGWAIFCSPMEMYAVDLWQCQPPGTSTTCSYIGGANKGLSRPDTTGYCGGNPGNNGWSYNWTIPAGSLLGQQTLWSIAINTSEKVDGSYKCTNWRAKSVNIVCPAAQSCAACHTNNYTITNGNGDCTDRYCPANAPAAQSCAACHTNNYWITNGNGDCTDRYCPANAPAYQACPTTCHTDYQYPPDGACGTHECPPPPPLADPICYGCSCDLASAPEANTACSVDWSDVTGANHYPFRADDVTIPGDTWSDTCAWTYPGDICLDAYSSYYTFVAKGGHTYNPWVHTVDNCNQWSSGIGCPVCTAPYCPLAPSSCGPPSSGSEANDNITVSWPDVASNESYKVQRSANGGVTWTNIVSGLGADATSYTDAGAKTCGTYTYRVASVRAGCTDKWVGCGSVAQVINAPTGLTATRVGCNANLSWTDNSNIEDSFVIGRALDYGSGYGYWAPLWASTGMNVTTATDTNVFCGANPARSAKYRVYAKNTLLGCTSAYTYSNEAFCPLDATTTSLIIVPDPPPDIVMAKTVNPYFRYDVVPQCGTFDHIEFSFDPTRLTNVTPTSSTSEPGTVSVTAGMTPGNTIITARVYLKPGPVLALTKEIPVEVIPPDPWWQTEDGDVHANVSITSLMPAIATVDKYLSLKGDGGMPGVVSYGNDYSLDAGSISDPAFNWQAKKSYSGDRVDYDYLLNRLNVNTSSDTFTGAMPAETGTYYSSSGKTLTGSFPAGKKITIFINGNATVGENVIVPVGGFFALIAKNGLTFAAGVTGAQGFYLSSGAMSVAAGNQLFEGEGSFIGWGGVSMGRDLAATSSLNRTPSEFFLFRPDLLINAPKEFLFTPFVFQEVAP